MQERLENNIVVKKMQCSMSMLSRKMPGKRKDVVNGNKIVYCSRLVLEAWLLGEEKVFLKLLTQKTITARATSWKDDTKGKRTYSLK